MKFCFLCGKSKAEDVDIRLFKAPKDEERRKQWINAVGKYLSRTSMVCSTHFNMEDMGRQKLRKDAIPLPMPPSLTTKGGKISCPRMPRMERKGLWIRSLKSIDITDSQLKNGSKNFTSDDLNDKYNPDWDPSCQNHIKKSRRLAVLGSVCNFCEKSVCSSRTCLETHAYNCPLLDAICIECNKGVSIHDGRLFRCSTCKGILCEQDQIEHQYSCPVLKAKTYKCQSCSKLGQYSCSRCKTCYCKDHVKTEGFEYEGNVAYMCPKCGDHTSLTEDFMSNDSHKFGRSTQSSLENDHNYYCSRLIDVNDKVVSRNKE